MRFQGENCTLSFGLHFERNSVLLNGSLWPRRTPSFDARYQSPRLRFSGPIPETDLTTLQQWLLAGSAEPLNLTGPIHQVRRLAGQPGDDMIHLELELRTQQVPSWWDWDIIFPLRLQLAIRSNEFTYLTNALSRDLWSANLTW